MRGNPCSTRLSSLNPPVGTASGTSPGRTGRRRRGGRARASRGRARPGCGRRRRVARIHALGTALVAEDAPRALPDTLLTAVLLEPLDGGAVTRVPDEAEALRERLRSEQLGIGLHRVALGDATAAVDAERLLLDRVHALLGDAVLAAVLRTLVARLKIRLHRLELVPEGIHVDHEV